MSSLYNPKFSRRAVSIFAIAAVSMLMMGRGDADTHGGDAPGPDEVLVIGQQSWGTERSLAWDVAASEQRLWRQVFDYLIYPDPVTRELKPGLATSWESSPDGRVWTLKIREGVPFHGDWGMLTSEDVRYTIEQMATRPDAAGSGNAYFRGLASIEAPDPTTVVLTFKEPTSELPYHLTPLRNLNVTSKNYVESVGDQQAGRHPIGTGPYRYVDGSPGDRHRFEAVENHWRIDPAYKNLEIRLISDPSAALAGVRSGELDSVQLTGDFLAQATRAGLRIQEVPAAAWYQINLNGQFLPDRPGYCGECPWVDGDDPDRAKLVREALNLAVNKQAIVDGIWQGYGSSDHGVSGYAPHAPGYDESWTVPPYDPERARELLAEAGYPDGFPIRMTLVRGQSSDGPDIGEAVAQDWERIGLTVERVTEDYATWIGKVRARSWDGSWAFAVQLLDEAQIFYRAVAYTGAAGIQLAESVEWDAAIDAISAEMDYDARAQLARNFGQMLYERMPAVSIGRKSITYAVSDKIGSWDLLTNNNETMIETIRP